MQIVYSSCPKSSSKWPYLAKISHHFRFLQFINSYSDQITWKILLLYMLICPCLSSLIFLAGRWTDQLMVANRKFQSSNKKWQIKRTTRKEVYLHFFILANCKKRKWIYVRFPLKGVNVGGHVCHFQYP
jgi:hypothetical protein